MVRFGKAATGRERKGLVQHGSARLLKQQGWGWCGKAGFGAAGFGEVIMRVLAIDPGPVKTGWTLMEGRRFLTGSSDTPNTEMHYVIQGHRDATVIAIEWIQSYGMSVGREVFHTCRWVGRFQQIADQIQKPTQLVYRRDVKLHLCNSVRAKDSNVRQAILDLYPATGGGSRPQIGTKKQRGPLYGVSGHMWPAVGLALTVQESEQVTQIDCCL